MQVKKQQLELGMEQQTGSEQEKDIVIIGIYDKLEVWSKEVYDNYVAGKSANTTDSVLEKMAQHGV